jgi:hypothetical protein
MFSRRASPIDGLPDTVNYFLYLSVNAPFSVCNTLCLLVPRLNEVFVLYVSCNVAMIKAACFMAYCAECPKE